MNVAVDPVIESLYRWSDVSGVLLMGIIGGTIARQRGYDIVGFFYIALFSALGGGMIRDVLINRGTVAAMSQPEYLILAFTGALIARFVYFKGKTWDRIEAHGDAVVSGLWAATGTVKAITYGLPILPCVMMGVFTATGGGMIRDIVTGRVPAVFGDNQPAVIPAVACAGTVLVSQHFDALAYGMILGPLFSIFLALLGYWAGWRISTNREWAPVNQTAAQVAVFARRVEDKGREVGRRFEPVRMRSWRHKQMEKALQRRIEAQMRKGVTRAQAESDAEEFLEEFSSQFPGAGYGAQAGVEGVGGGVAGNIGDIEGAGGIGDAGRATPRRGRSVSDEVGVDLHGDSYKDYEEYRREPTGQDYGRMLDMILADDALTDQLIEKLAKKYREG